MKRFKMDRKNRAKKRLYISAGFTMVELIVVMAIMGILLGVGAWGLLSWHNHSEYIKNEETAKTIFLAAQSALSESDALGTLDADFTELEEEMLPEDYGTTQSYMESKFLPDDAKDPDAQGIVHDYKYIVSSKGSGTDSGSTFEEYISDYIYDAGIFDGGYIIEFDVTSQSVYGVFYSEWASIEYADSGTSNSRGTYYITDSTTRKAEARSKYLVGYCGSSVADMAKLDAIKLKLTQLTLNNEETLNVRFGSNSQSQELDTVYTLTFYEEDEDGDQTIDTDHELFTISFVYKDAGLTQTGTNSKIYSGYVDSTITLADHLLDDVNTDLESEGVITTTSEGKTLDTRFLVTYNGSNYELVLDAIMDSYMREYVDNATADSVGYDVDNSMSITRILGCKPENIFVVGTVGANEDTLASLTALEYVSGSPITSETQNDLFATIDERADYNPYANTPVGDEPSMQVSLNRHFNNIRYATSVASSVSGASSTNQPIIQMTSDIDWSSSVVYGMESETETEPVELTATPAFPSIEDFPENYILDGNGMTYSNIVLTEESGINIDSSDSPQIRADQIAMFKENNGTIKEMAISDATLLTLYGDNSVTTLLAGEDFVDAISDSDSTLKSSLEEIYDAAMDRYSVVQNNLESAAGKAYLHTAALLCGTNKGDLSGIMVDDGCGVYAGLAYDKDLVTDGEYGIGLLCGVLDVDEDRTVDRILTNGAVNAVIEDLDGSSFTIDDIAGGDASTGYKYAGIGGVAGYFATEESGGAFGALGLVTPATLTSSTATGWFTSVSTKSITNYAQIKGNMYTGGIVGNAYMKTSSTYTLSTDDDQIVNAHNLGLILATWNPSGDFSDTAGDSDVLDALEEDDATFATIDGYFFGGIVGYGCNISLEGCTHTTNQTKATELGSADSTTIKSECLGFFVGGISGFLESGYIVDCSTQSGGYILGYDYVGGIAGTMKGIEKQISTSSASTVNNACYVLGHSFVGGIVGANNAGSVIQYCVNNGVAAGYGIDIGGIVGKNKGTSTNYAKVIDCGGNLYDYGNAAQSLIVSTWEFLGSNVGGQVGYNEYGSIEYSDNITSGSYSGLNQVSSVAVGMNNIGGFVGLNGPNGQIVINEEDGYISGSVYGEGDCVGGYIGLNLSKNVFATDSTNEMSVSTKSVDGSFCVGGLIGANIILTDEDIYTEMKYLNSVSTIQGESIVGGLLGYSALLSSITSTDGITDTFELIHTGVEDFDGSSSDKEWHTVFLTTDSSTTLPVNTTSATVGGYNLTFGYNTDNTLVIGPSGSSKVTYNNAQISAFTLGGGLIGMNCPDSKMLVRNALNTGRITERTDITDGSKYVVGSIISYSAVTDQTALLGGIVSYNTKYSIIDNCESTGTLSMTYGGAGGIVGLNNGYIVNCERNAGIGGSAYNYIGGIAGINYNSGQTKYVSGTTSVCDGTTNAFYSYKDDFDCGKIEDCVVGESATVTVSGKNYVGGIAGLNFRTDSSITDVALIKDCMTIGNVTGTENVGGLVGSNRAVVETDGTLQKFELNVSGVKNVGGVVGINCGSDSTTNPGIGEIDFVDATVTDPKADTYVFVTSSGENAGGIVGYLETGNIIGEDTSDDTYVRNYAKVTATGGYAGGIAGKSSAGSTIKYAANYGTIQASTLYAGGIISINESGSEILYSNNYGDVIATSNYGSGIAATNSGDIVSCGVYADSDGISIKTSGTKVGLITCINYEGGLVEECSVGVGKTGYKGYITLDASSATKVGFLVGVNDDDTDTDSSGGTVNGGYVGKYITYSPSASGITLGGAVGVNQYGATVTEVTGVARDFKDISGIKYLGGIVGDNKGTISSCKFGDSNNSYSIEYTTDATVGDCFGGIAGRNGDGSNAATITDCKIENITIDVIGISNADPAQSSSEKVENVAFIGGITGHNKENATVTTSYLQGDDNTIHATYGMIGGIAGANEGTLNTCGYYDSSSSYTDALIADVKSIFNDGTNVLSTDSTISDILINHTGTDSTSQTVIQLGRSGAGDGYLGGITGFNATTGTVKNCASGKWFVYGDRLNINACVGGVIGDNETDNDTTWNCNCAYVRRRVASTASYYYVGGVIGEQQNRTSTDWTIESCFNFGSVDDVNSHNSGGVIARWSTNGGTVQKCVNYGRLTTNYQEANRGTVGGVVGFVREPVNGHTYNVISCENHGVVNYFTSKGANDCAGILAEVNTQGSSEQIYINVIDCINGSDAYVYAYSMADGIVSWIGGDNTNKTAVHIDRCRNYCSNLLTRNNSGSGIPNSRGRTGGIYGTSTTPGTEYGYICITNCFSVTTNAKNTGTTKDTNGYPIAFVQEGNSTAALRNCSGNYYMDSLSFTDGYQIGDFDSGTHSGICITNAELEYYTSATESVTKGLTDTLSNNTLSYAFDGNTNTYAAQNYYSGTEATITISLSDTADVSEVSVKAWATGTNTEEISVTGSTSGKQEFNGTQTKHYTMNQSLDQIEVVVNKGTNEYGGYRFTIYEIVITLTDGSTLTIPDSGEQYGASYLGAKRIYYGYSDTSTSLQAKYGNAFAANVDSNSLSASLLASNGYTLEETDDGNDVIKDSSKNTSASIMFRCEKTSAESDVVIDDVYEQYLDYVDSLGWLPPINVTLNKTAVDDDESIGSYVVTWEDQNSNPKASSYEVSLYVYKAEKDAAITYTDGVLYDANGNALEEVSALTQTDTVYSESADFTITDSSSVDTANYDYYVIAKVVAVGTSEKSEAGISGYEKLETALIKPELEVVRVNGSWRIRLANADEYEAAYMDASGNWTVDFYVKAVIVNANGTSEYSIYTTKINGDYYAVNSSGGMVTIKNVSNRPLRGTAIPLNDDATTYIRSQIFSANIFVPNGSYTSANTLTVDETPANGYGFGGSSSSDFTYTASVTLTTADSYPQIYRAELLGDSGDGNGYQTVVAYKDIALSDGVAVTLEFNNISSDILEQFTGFKVAMYYASSGLGPVYTYSEVTDEDDITTVAAYSTPRTNGYDRVLNSDGSTYTYYYADPLKVNSGASNGADYWIGAEEAIFIDPPVLEAVDCVVGTYDGTTFTADADGNLLYHFTWDTAVTESYDYDIEVYGIQDSAKTLIDTGYNSTTFMGRSDDSVKDFYMNADEWAYDQIYIKVTTKASNTGSGTYILGQSSEGTYDVTKRLSKPLAITYTETEIDELIYSFGWTAYTDSDEVAACDGYNLMISYDDGAGNTVTEQIGSTTNGTSISNVYMDDYAGKSVTMYIVGVADTSSDYIDSLAGAETVFTVETRYDQPSATYTLVEVSGSTVTDLSATEISEDEFTNSLGLKTVATAGSTAGSTYIVSGILCSDATTAANILTALGSSEVSTTNTNKSIMERVNTVLDGIADGTYSAETFGFDQTLNSSNTTITTVANGNFSTNWSTSYAQYYLIPFIRNGGSEKGTSVYNWNSTYLQLPKVKLNTPTITYAEKTGISATGRTYGTDYTDDTGEVSASGLKLQQFVIQKDGTGLPDYYQITMNDVKKSVLVTSGSGAQTFEDQDHTVVIKVYPATSSSATSYVIEDTYGGNTDTYTDASAYVNYAYGYLNSAACSFAFNPFTMEMSIDESETAITITMPNIATGTYAVTSKISGESKSNSYTVSNSCASGVTCTAVITSTDSKYVGSEETSWVP